MLCFALLRKGETAREEKNIVYVGKFQLTRTRTKCVRFTVKQVCRKNSQ